MGQWGAMPQHIGNERHMKAQRKTCIAMTWGMSGIFKDHFTCAVASYDGYDWALHVEKLSIPACLNIFFTFFIDDEK